MMGHAGSQMGGQHPGLLRVYADRVSGRLLGATMIGPCCAHLAQLLAWAVASGRTVEQTLAMPFYHPVIEDALQEALLDLQHELIRRGPTRPRRWIWLWPRQALGCSQPVR